MKNNVHDINMLKALAEAMQSKCSSMQVGCIAVNERGRTISTGVNGTPSGFVNCNEVFANRCAEHSAWSEKFEIHAEMNCILELTRSSISFKEITFYTTHSPCSNCCKHMIGLAWKGDVVVKSIIYNEVYYKTTEAELTELKNWCTLFSVKLLSIEEARRGTNELQS